MRKGCGTISLLRFEAACIDKYPIGPDYIDSSCSVAKKMMEMARNEK